MRDQVQANGRAGYSPLPLFIDMRGRKVLIVGGGCVAQRKLETLVEHGCQATVIAPQATEKVHELADRGSVDLFLRPFRDDDVQGFFLVFACTDSQELNRRIADAAKASGALVNCVDSQEPEVSVPATLHRGDLQIAISTSGSSPALARKLRCALEEAFPQDFDRAVGLIGQARQMILDRIPDPGTRHRLNRLIAEDRFIQRTLVDQAYTAEALFADACNDLTERGES